jgi:hypothetical protein
MLFYFESEKLTLVSMLNSNQLNSTQIKSTQIKSNQIEITLSSLGKFSVIPAEILYDLFSQLWKPMFYHLASIPI